MRLHIVFELDGHGKIHGCGYIRLLHPFSHPSLSGRVEVTSGETLPDGPVDAAIVERLCRADMSLAAAERLLARFEERGIPLLYTIDDNLFDLNRESGIWRFPSEEQRCVMRLLARCARGVIVSTPLLAERVRRLNPRVVVVPNQIDERLFTRRAAAPRRDKIRLGYMGTPTHLEDLLMILTTLRRFLSRWRDRVTFEIIGVAEERIIRDLFGGLPVSHKVFPPDAAAYPAFARWMNEQLHWDFAIAPLKATPFSICKSDLKMLDYGILGIPGIFSDVPCYDGTVRQSENGLLAANTESAWEEALEAMASDDGLRARLAANVAREVWETRTLAQNAPRWEAAVRELLAA